MAGARRRPQVLGGVEEVHDPHRVREPITVQPPQPFSAVAKAHADVLGRVAERRQFAQQPPRQRRVAAGVVRRALVRPEGALRTTRRPEPSTVRSPPSPSDATIHTHRPSARACVRDRRPCRSARRSPTAAPKPPVPSSAQRRIYPSFSILRVGARSRPTADGRPPTALATEIAPTAPSRAAPPHPRPPPASRARSASPRS